MGASVADGQRGDINTIVKSLEEAIEEARKAKSV